MQNTVAFPVEMNYNLYGEYIISQMERLSMKKTISVLTVLVLLIAVFPSAIYSDAYSDAAYSAVLNGLKQGLPEISLSAYGLTQPEVKALFEEVLYNNPELFYIGTSFSVRIVSSKVTALMPQYTMSGTELAAAKVYFNSEIDRIAAYVPAGLSDIQTALFLHDYICVNYEYDNSLVSSNAYSMLKEGKGVCMAYTLLYDALLSEFGIESQSVTSTEINHMWNRVKLGGKWYNIDVTMDDPVADRFGRANHTYFLLSDTAISSDHGSSYGGFGTATDTGYDTFSWHGVSAPFAFAGGKTYCISGASICTVDISSGIIAEVYQITDKWYVWGSNSYYTGCYSGLGSYGKYVIFNTADRIYAFDTSSHTVTEVYGNGYGDGYIYYCFAYGGNVSFAVAQNPSLSVTKRICSVPITLGSSYRLGDVNMNGSIEAADYLMTKRAFLGSFVLSAKQTFLADVNGNGIVDATDYLMIKRHFLGTYTIK